MCRAEETLQLKTLARGRAEGRLNTVCALIKDGLLSIEVASAKFNIPIETIQAYLDGSQS